MTERLAPPPLPGWLASQVPFDRYLVEVDDGTLMHVMEQGEGRPVLLFHGFPTWGFLYRKVAYALAGEQYRLIMPDLVGLGFSSRVAARFTLSDQIEWTVSLIEKLGLDEVTAVVQDWGGPIGLGALARNSAQLRGLVVLNTTLGPPKPGFKPTTFHRTLANPIFSTLAKRFGLVEKNLARAQGDPTSIAGLVKEAYVYPLRELGNDALVSFGHMVPDTMEHPSVAELALVGDFIASYGGPAAIVWGEKDPVLGRLLNRTQRVLPEATVTATDAGHFLQEEVPAEIAAAIRSL